MQLPAHVTSSKLVEPLLVLLVAILVGAIVHFALGGGGRVCGSRQPRSLNASTT